MAVNKYDLIRSPIITEKSTFLGELGKYVFEVARNAEKASIKKFRSAYIRNLKGPIFVTI